MKQKVISFLRVSTDAQDTARQKADVARVIAANNLEVLRTLELIDVSGRKVMHNRDVRAVLRDLNCPYIAGIAISALDRLFRPNNYSDFSILDAFRETRKLIFSAKEGVLDPASDAGFMMSLMSGAQVGMEWRELRRRTVGGKAEKVRWDAMSTALPCCRVVWPMSASQTSRESRLIITGDTRSLTQAASAWRMTCSNQATTTV